MTLLSPRKSTFSVSHAILSTEDDPAVWAIQNKSLLSIRSAKGAIAAYVGEGCDAATKRERSQRYSELHGVMSFFLQRSGDRTDGEHLSIPRPQKNYTALLHSILLDSGIRGAPSRDVIAHFSACTGLVNGTLSGTMKKALSEIQARSDSFIQSDSTHVRMISHREVPQQVLQYARDTRLSILETDLLLHFLDNPNKSVSLVEVQVLSAKDSSRLNDLDDALQEVEAFFQKIANGPFVIVRQDGERLGEAAWRLRMEPELHHRLATNTISSAELPPWRVASKPLELLKLPSFAELAKIQSKERKLSTVAPEHKDAIQGGSEPGATGPSTRRQSTRRQSTKEPSPDTTTLDAGNFTEANASMASPTEGAVQKGASPTPAIPSRKQTVPKRVSSIKQTANSPSALMLPAVISDYITQRADELGRLCKNELATEMVCSGFEQRAREEAAKVAHYHRKSVVDRFAAEFTTEWQHLFTVEETSQLFSKWQFQDYTPVSYPAGSREKLDIFSRRYESGLPLFHPEDRDVAYPEDDYDDFGDPSEEHLRALSHYESDL